MKNNFSSQIFIKVFDCPFEIIESIFQNHKLTKQFFESSYFKIKRFLGSNINIDGSGYIWQGKNQNNFSVESSTQYIKGFSKSYFFRIMHINESKINENISIETNIYKNTYDKSTIIEFCFTYSSNNNYINLIKETLLNFKIKDFIKLGCENLNNYIKNCSEFRTIYHSLLLNKDYKSAYKIFRDFYATAKALGTDKVWDIKYENNSLYSVNMNNGICIDYHIYKEEENDDNSKSIFYHKFKDDIPSLNEWIKGDFYNISKDRCFLVHQTKIPLKINCNLHETINNYTFYVLKKWRAFVESQRISSIDKK